MRVIATLNKHPKVSTSVFQMNDKFIIKFEAGNMEQVFKINQAEVSGVEGIDRMLDEIFITKVVERFNEMFLALKEAGGNK
ncbi:MAG: hypothetical protein IT235_09165 [Bacteroidia bacterium]|nr:hypothetical protein [Bacteroidia bacterium]